MFTSSVIFCVLVLLNIFVSIAPLSPLTVDAMEKDRIVPDVIDKAPPEILEVTYTNNLKVQMGNKLTPRQTKDPPITLNWPSIDNNTYYMLFLIDPDAPSRNNPKAAQWRHWIVGNIPGKQIDKTDDVLADYIGPAPPKNSGYHRYIFLIYQQPNKIQFDEQHLKNTSGSGRAKFSMKNFAKKYNLGHPIAGNFFLAQWDDYVPEVYKRLA